MVLLGHHERRLSHARADRRGLTCFLVPRWRPDGTQNAFAIQRLKDKLGNRSNASSEIEYRDTWAQRIGEEGRGVPTIIEMVNHTRLDCVIGSAALMRQAVAQAVHHAAYRRAFGKRLIDQPAMHNVLADLALESEAATALMMRLARAYDQPTDEHERAFARIATAVGKFWVCKRAPQQSAKPSSVSAATATSRNRSCRACIAKPAEFHLGRLGQRHVSRRLRAIQREPHSLEALITELRTVKGTNAEYDRLLAQIEIQLRATEDAELPPADRREPCSGTRNLRLAQDGRTADCRRVHRVAPLRASQ